MASLKERFDLADFISLAAACIDQIWHSGRLPMVVGGTGFYIKGLLEGVESLGVEPDLILRQTLSSLTVDELADKLQGLNMDKWQSLNYSDRKNPRRLIRAIEIAQSAKLRPLPLTRLSMVKADVLKIGLTAPRAVLFDKVNQWVASRTTGIIKEVKNLKKAGVTAQKLAELGFVYKLVNLYNEGQLTLEQFENELKKEMRHYVIRQLAWFKKDHQIVWFDITNPNLYSQVEQIVVKWYNNQ